MKHTGRQVVPSFTSHPGQDQIRRRFYRAPRIPDLASGACNLPTTLGGGQTHASGVQAWGAGRPCSCGWLFPECRWLGAGWRWLGLGMQGEIEPSSWRRPGLGLWGQERGKVRTRPSLLTWEGHGPWDVFPPVLETKRGNVLGPRSGGSDGCRGGGVCGGLSHGWAIPSPVERDPESRLSTFPSLTPSPARCDQLSADPRSCWEVGRTGRCLRCDLPVRVLWDPQRIRGTLESLPASGHDSIFFFFLFWATSDGTRESLLADLER